MDKEPRRGKRAPFWHAAEGGIDDNRLAEIAALYYQRGSTQEELSQRLHLSRVTVGRLLHQAREKGIVTIKVLQHPDVSAALEDAFRRRFGISRLLVSIDCPTPERQRAAVGSVVADWLVGQLSDETVVTVGMGRNVAAVVTALDAPPRRATTFVSALGGSIDGQETNADAISRRFAAAFGGESETLYVPLRVPSPGLRRELLLNDTVRSTLDHARRADLALIGIGNFAPDSRIVRLGWISPAEFESLQTAGVVGEINFEDYFDVHGRPVGAELRGRTVGLNVADLARIPEVLAVVSEPEKAAATLGALRTGILSILATSTAMAGAILELDAQTTGL